MPTFSRLSSSTGKLTAASTIMLPFQPGKPATIQQQRHRKKKVFGKRRSSYDPRSKSLVSNGKRIPLDIHVTKEHITPKDNNGRQLTKSKWREEGRHGLGTAGGTGLSSLTAPTTIVCPARARTVPINSASQLLQLAANEKNKEGSSEDESLNFHGSNVAVAVGAEESPLLPKVKSQKAGRVVSGKQTKNSKEDRRSDIIDRMHRHFTVKNKGGKRENARGGLKSTKKRLSYGVQEEDTSNVLTENQPKKRGRSWEDHQRDERRMSNKSTTAKGSACTRENPKDTTTAVSRRNSIQPKTNSSKSGTNAKKSKSTRGIFQSSRRGNESSKRTSFTPSTKSIIVRTKSSSSGVQIPGKLTQRSLLELAKLHSGTAVQYIATYHTGEDSILDKNFSKEKQFLIEPGDMVIQQDYANQKGTYWTAKFSFRHWKLPGQRKARGESIYVSSRPMLAEDTDNKDHEGEGGVRPRLTMDTTLTAKDASMVRTFVKEAKAGQTPFNYFPESELGGARYRQNDDDGSDDDRGGDGFSFVGTMDSSDAKSLEEQNPKKRKVFGDRSNTSNQAGHLNSYIVGNRTSLQKTLKSLDKPRTKLARNKRKSLDPPVLLPSIKSSKKKPRTPIQFFIRAFGRDENGGYQDQKHFGLIEGMRGGEEEIEKGTTLPHRGRLVELPGSVMPGKWEALVLYNDALNQNDEEDGSLQSLRISLRHNRSSSTPLEKYYSGQESTPDGLAVSIINPSICRVSSFKKQGIFTSDEKDFCVEDEEKAKNGLGIGCLSLVTFGGFATSSEAVNDAGGDSEAILARCASKNQRVDQHELQQIVAEENEKEAMGVLFPCKINFDNDYSLIMSVDDRSRVTAIDVIFRKPKAPQMLSTQHVGLTESILSDHLDRVGFIPVEEIMERFEDELTPDTSIATAMHLQQFSGFEKQGNKSDYERHSDAVEVPHTATGKVPVDVEEEGGGGSQGNISTTSKDRKPEREDQSNFAGGAPAKAGKKVLPCAEEGATVDDSNADDETQDGNNSTSDEIEADAVLQNDGVHDDIESTAYGGTGEDVVAQQVDASNADDREEDCDEDIMQDNVSFDASGCGPFEDCGGDRVVKTSKNDEDKTPFESSRKFSQVSPTDAIVPTSESEENAKPHRRLSASKDKSASIVNNGDRSVTRKDVHKTPSDRRLSAANRKIVEAEEDVIDDSLSVRPRRRSTGSVSIRKDTARTTVSMTTIHVRSQLKPLQSFKIKRNDPLSKLINAYCKQYSLGNMRLEYSGRVLDANKSPGLEGLPGVVHLDAVVAVGGGGGSSSKHNILQGKDPQQDTAMRINRLSLGHSAHASSIANQKSAMSGQRATLSCRHTTSKQRKKVVVDDLFGDTDSLFGCKIITYGKSSNAGENNAHLLESVKKSSLKYAGFKSHRSVSRDFTPSGSVGHDRVVQPRIPRGRKSSIVEPRAVDEPRAVAEPQNDQTSLAPPDASAAKDTNDEIDTMENHNSQDDDELSFYSAACGCSFGSYNDVQAENQATTPSNASVAQPLYDVYFGCESESVSDQPALQPTSPLLETYNNEPQPFHDYYYGKESCFEIPADDYYGVSAEPPHGVYFGLDDDDSADQSELEFSSLVCPLSNESVTFHDYYFGKEPCLVDDDDNVNESKKVVTRIPRCNVQTKPFLVMALLAGLAKCAF